MRICFLNHDLKGNTGAGRFGLKLIEAIQRLVPEIEIRVLTSEDSGHPLELPLLYPRQLGFMRAFPRIRRLLKNSDIIHALDGFPYGVIAVLAGLGLGKKIVITAIGTGAIQAFRHPARGMLLSRAYRRADALLAVSTYTQRELISRLPDLSIEVIPHAVDMVEFEGGLAQELSGAEYSCIEKMKPYVLSVGAWKRRKGFEYSFPAFAEIADEFPKLSYAVVGAEDTPAVAHSLGVAGKTFCFRDVSRPFLKALYRNAELFLLLPFNDQGDVEGFGFVFLEAAAAGIPVIGTRESGAESAVRHGKNGFLVRPRNAEEAGQAMRRILGDPALKRRFSSGSLEFARVMKWETVAARYLEIYQRLLAYDS